MKNTSSPTGLESTWQILREYAETRPEVLTVYLFGSQAAGRADVASDVDVALLLRQNLPDLAHLTLRLNAEICRVLDSDNVDVLILNSAPLPLRAEVIRTGQVIASKDDEARIDFEVQTMNEWWDFKPLLNEMDRIFFQRVKERFTDDQRRTYLAAREALARTH